MDVLIEDEEFLKKYSNILDRVGNSMKKEFDGENF